MEKMRAFEAVTGNPAPDYNKAHELVKEIEAAGYIKFEAVFDGNIISQKLGLLYAAEGFIMVGYKAKELDSFDKELEVDISSGDFELFRENAYIVLRKVPKHFIQRANQPEVCESIKFYK